jgi:hypothetical protein
MNQLDERIAEKLAEKVKAGALTRDEVPLLYKDRVKELVND